MIFVILFKLILSVPSLQITQVVSALSVPKAKPLQNTYKAAVSQRTVVSYVIMTIVCSSTVGIWIRCTTSSWWAVGQRAPW